MDVVTDLSAHAISFLSVYQDICKITGKDTELSIEIVTKNTDYFKNLNLDELSSDSKDTIDRLIGELIWKCGSADNALLGNFGEKIKVLAAVMHEGRKGCEVSRFNEDSPYHWRRCLKYVFYDKPEHRMTLANALEYMPIQVIMAMGRKKEKAYNKRLYQVWGEGKERLNGSDKRNLSAAAQYTSERNKYDKWWDTPFLHDNELTLVVGGKAKRNAQNLEPYKRKNNVEFFLTNDQALINRLNINEISLPFETLFVEELNEIEKSRESRIIELKDVEEESVWSIPKANYPEILDPLKRAEKMNLYGLAFSGGGIRSATFNLGVIQKLAEMDVLKRFDYISTVSGGGYIGSWLISWFHRSSFSKVNLRLNPKISAEPMGEEVRPIRWLRMYSNYLSPNNGIMSGDAWTVGMTWVRNTIVNLSVLFLLLCTLLVGITCFYELRNIGFIPTSICCSNMFLYSLILFSVGAALTAAGMSVFDSDQHPSTRIRFGASPKLPFLLIIWGIITSFLISLWLSKNISEMHEVSQYITITFVPFTASTFIAMIIIASFGGYFFQKGSATFFEKILTVVLSSIVASGFGAVILGVAWYVLALVYNNTVLVKYREECAFMFGVPLVLETISFCVVIRMALMGKFFSDERREWWGRIGGLVHRTILIWMVICFCALVLPDLFRSINWSQKIKVLLPAAASWTAIIGLAIKFAFSSKDETSVTKKQTINYKEIFIRFAPYLFMVGFLLLGSMIFRSLLNYLGGTYYQIANYILLFIVLGFSTCIISWRVGVNEFSLHHFYRNRLTRAYLGATRRRTDRDQTSNKFTGFDSKDDIKLNQFCSPNYNGPYPIINTCLNATTVSALDRQDRKAESFILSPLYCGFDFSSVRSASEAQNGIFQYGYRPTKEYSEIGGPSLGTAMAVSGAAVNPNMGYHSSSPTAFMLTIFNVRLGRWIGNPRLDQWKKSDPELGIGYLIGDLVGTSDIDSDFVCLSDGGHFDNMGLYELIRRKCSYILLCDAEEDHNASCEGLANAIRRCRIDFGVEIDINIDAIIDKDLPSNSQKHIVNNGKIYYPGDIKPSGKITYIKANLTGNEDVDIRQYQMNNEDFPQQSTGDQFFDETQFESYRKLGYHSIENKKEL